MKAEEAVMAKMGNLPPMSAAYISLRERAAKRKQGSSAPNVAIDIVVVKNIYINDKHKILRLQDRNNITVAMILKYYSCND